MTRIHMIASKRLRYGTRALRAGDTFEATRQDARVLTAVGLAREARANVYAPLVNVPVRKPAPVVDELETLREAYKAKTGRRPHYTWTAERIREAIADLDVSE
jgi:hypothetical protein